MPSCQRLKILVRRHIDRMIRTRNFRAWNERIETGVFLKSHKGKNLSVERRSEECYQWKTNGQCSRGDSSSFSHGSDCGRRTRSSSRAPKKLRHRLTEESPRKAWAPQEKVPLEGNVKNCAKNTPKELVRIRRVIVGILPHVRITYLNRDANLANYVHLDTLRLTDGPVKSRRKVTEKGSVALLMKSFQLGCVSQDTESPNMSVPQKSGKVGSNRAVTCSKGTWHHKNSGKKGSISRGYAKVRTSRTGKNNG